MINTDNAKQDKNKQRQRQIYSTKIINEMMKDINRGIVYDENPFFQNDQNFRGENVMFKLTDEEYEERTKCSCDPVYFISKYIPFENDHGVTLVQLRSYQKKFVHLLTDEKFDDDLGEFVPLHRNVISMMSRQTAKTTTVCAAFAWYVCFHNDKHLAIVANKAATVNEIFRKLFLMLSHLPWFLKPGLTGKNQTSLSLDNGTFVRGFATSKTPAIGFTIHYLYIDEAALIPNNIMKDFWTAIYPTLSSSKLSKITLTSTPRGRQNKFYELWHRSELKLNSFIHYKVDYWQVPGHDKTWAEAQRADFGDVEFAQEFELQWDVASTKLVRPDDMQFMHRIGVKYVNVDIPTIPSEICSSFYWHPGFDPTSVDRLKEHFFLSIDTAEGKAPDIKGKADSDYNVINIFRLELMNPQTVRRFSVDNKVKLSDCFRFRQVGVYYDNNTDEETMAKAAKYLVYDTWHNGTGDIDIVRILLEMNFNGKNWLNIFMDNDRWYEELVLKTYHTKPIPGKFQKKQFGYKTTSGGAGIGKSYFCESGAKMITKKQIIISQQDNRDENHSTIGELGAFDKTRKTHGSEYFTYQGIGLHDDLAYTVLSVSRAPEISDYTDWLEGIFDSLPTSPRKTKVQELLNLMPDDGDTEMSDDAFSSAYMPTPSQPNKIIQDWLRGHKKSF